MPSTLTYNGRGVFGSFEVEVVDGIRILAADERLTALQTEVTEVQQVDDKINGKTVISVAQYPAGAT